MNTNKLFPECERCIDPLKDPKVGFDGSECSDCLPYYKYTGTSTRTCTVCMTNRVPEDHVGCICEEYLIPQPLEEDKYCNYCDHANIKINGDSSYLYLTVEFTLFVKLNNYPSDSTEYS